MRTAFILTADDDRTKWSSQRGGESADYCTAGGAGAVEHLGLVVAEVQVATVRNHVTRPHVEPGTGTGAICIVN